MWEPRLHVTLLQDSLKHIPQGTLSTVLRSHLVHVSLILDFLSRKVLK